MEQAQVGGKTAGMSLLNAMYYAFKPYLPKSVRYTMRRLRANYKLRTTPHWPIMESAGGKPPGWNGWPGGKQFAVVLTHDVEGALGFHRCRQLAALESRLGFCSSFNLIPEGEYEASKPVRDELVRLGFEVGVHDLRHDGSLYRSKSSFDICAGRINSYLDEWGAVGFRAGFMFHNLEWLKALNVEYDASTFDVDPFEPQPDGVGTIFPFWVSRGVGDGGYVELPYTLPQDATMFLVLRLQDIDIWKRKVDWLASKGGMVLLNLHPDYVAFEGRKPGVSEFPARLYEELLTYLQQKYHGAFWHALPRDVARFYRQTAEVAPVSAAGMS